MWKCGSTKGGLTRSPVASITRPASASSRPMAAMRSPVMPMSATRAVGQRAALAPGGRRPSALSAVVGDHQRRRHPGAAGHDDEGEDRQRVGQHQEDLVGHDGRRGSAAAGSGRRRRRRRAARRAAPCPAARRRRPPARCRSSRARSPSRRRRSEKAESVRNAPPTAISPLPTTTAPMRSAGHRQPLRLDRLRVLADRAEREAERRAGEHQRDDGDGGEGEVGQRRLRQRARAAAAARRARCAAAWSPRGSATR